ncbi:uncharacterized protein [Dysidea avara]|uniref:uncharacterized protein n=1 Tax=Dysidea avara TaxID=196820 RepID=UPI00332A62B4
MWNSRSHRIIGLAMTEETQASLHDVFQLFDKDHRTKQTNYILQFLWRDLTSSFDIVGPFYTSNETMQAKFICSCVFQTLKLFKVHDLRTCLLVCDGAAPNLAALKLTHRFQGMYGLSDGPDPYAVRPWFVNPHDPLNRIYWLICPSHQLKNMINALFSSQEGGTRTFTAADGTTFGWKAILDLYSRECQRRDQGHARMIPKLREVHVLRDAWTKLNVLPAKIMQQELVMSELHHYLTSDPAPDDVASVKYTLQYLEACNKIFEKGLLSHDKICDVDSKVLHSISTGFSFFEKWHGDLSREGGLETLDPRFLSWQTFDLLRICVYGFSSFVQTFLEEFPDYFISPVRLSGSAVETLFSQLKHTAAGGKLSSVNYVTARAAHLIKHSVAYHHSSVNYRDVPLHLSDTVLQKKKYKHKQ